MTKKRQILYYFLTSTINILLAIISGIILFFYGCLIEFIICYLISIFFGSFLVVSFELENKFFNSRSLILLNLSRLFLVFLCLVCCFCYLYFCNKDIYFIFTSIIEITIIYIIIVIRWRLE